MRTTLILRALTLGVGIVLLPAAKSADAQEPSPTPAVSAPTVIQAGGVDARWIAWLGCWQLFEEGVRDEDVAGTADTLDEAQEPVSVDAVEDFHVCIVPGDSPPSVEMKALAGGQTVLEQTVVADGAERQISEADCRGWQRAEWSQSGQHLLTRAELSCGDEPRRLVSGLTMMARRGIWIDVQTVRIGSSESIRVRRYRRALDEPSGVVLAPDLLKRSQEGARLAGAMPLGVQDVIEANAKIAPRAVEAALVERGTRFDLDSRALIALDDGGVGDEVIDLMVALSFPDRFVVDQPGRGASGSLGSIGSPFGSFDASWYSDFAPYYYDYSPFGYSSWGSYYGYGPFYSSGPGTFVVLPAVDADSRVEGRVVNGLGYTRVRPRDASTAQASGGGSSSASSSSGGSVGSSSGSSSGGGAMTPSGATSSGSGGSSGRTAVPR